MSRLPCILILFLVLHSIVAIAGTDQEALEGGVSQLNGNAQARTLGQDTTVNGPNGQSNLKAGSTAGVKNGQLQSDKLAAAKNNAGGSLGESTNAQMNPDGSMKAGETKEAKTKTAQIKNAQNAEISADGTTVKADKVEKAQSQTQNRQVNTEQATNYQSDGQTVQVGSAARIETRPSTSGSTSPSATAPSTQQPHVTVSGVTRATQQADGTFTAQRAQRAAISNMPTDDTTIQQAIAGNPPSNRPLLLMDNVNNLRVEPNGQISGSSAQNLRLYLPQRNSQTGATRVYPEGTQTYPATPSFTPATPTISIINARNFQIRIPGASQIIPLDQRQPVPADENKLLQTLLKLSNVDFSLQSADQLFLLGAEHKNPRDVRTDISGKIYHVTDADEIKIGHLTLIDVKDVTILFNSNTAIFFKDNTRQLMTLDGNPLEYRTVSKDNKLEAAPPATLAKTQDRRTINIQGGAIKLPHDPKKLRLSIPSVLDKESVDQLLHAPLQVFDIIEAGNQTALTIMPDNGLECVQFIPVGAYSYKTPEIESIFTIAILKEPHKVCLRKLSEQSYPSCDECTNIDFVENNIVSQGTAQYRRYHYQKIDNAARLVGFVTEPRYNPIISGYAKFTMDDRFDQIRELRVGAKRVYHEIIPNNFLTITDRSMQGLAHRFIKIDPAISQERVSDNIIEQLLAADYPRSYKDGKEWKQATDDGQPRIRVLMSGDPLIDELVKENQDTILETTGAQS